MVIHHQQVQLFLITVLLLVNCRKQHTAGLYAHHCSWGKVCNGNQGLSYQLFRLIVCMNSGKDRSVATASVIQGKLQELLGLCYRNAVLYLYCTEVGLTKGLEIHSLFKQWLDFYITEINLIVWRKEAGVGISCFTLFSLLSLILLVQGLHCGENKNLGSLNRYK